MAKGKKSSGNHYTSKGIVGTNKKLSNALRRDRMGDEETNKFRAYLKGKRVWFTVPNPDKKKTNQRFIRVLGTDLYGGTRNFQKNVLIPG